MQNAESLLVMPTSAQLLERMMASADRPDRLIPAIDMVTFLRPEQANDGGTDDQPRSSQRSLREDEQQYARNFA
jgi:hypothetical protein